MAVTRALLLRALLPLLVGITGCLPGPEDVVRDANAELVVVGLEPGERLVVALAGRTYRQTAGARSEVRLFFRLPVGVHEGALEVTSPAGQPRCASFTLRIDDASSSDVASVDVRAAPACAAPGGTDDAGPPPDVTSPDDAGEDAGAPGQDAGALDAGPMEDAGSPEDAGDHDGGAKGGGELDGGSDERDGGPPDAGAPEQDGGPPDAGRIDGGVRLDAGPPETPIFAFVRERTTTPGACGAGTCTAETTVYASGEVELRQNGAAQTGTAPDDLLEALALESLSEEADALFQDGCSGEPGSTTVVLTRQVFLANGPVPEVVTLQQDVTGCLEPIVGSLRSYLEAVRQAAFP